MRILFSLVAFLALGCNKGEYFGPISESADDSGSVTSSSRLLIGNEGNFQFGNASITVLDFHTGQQIQNATSALQPPLGDVLQSLLQVGDTLFCVMNNSGSVVMLDANSLTVIDRMNGFTSPRYLLQIAPNRFLVSDLYADGLTLFDAKQMTIEPAAECKGWSEQMALLPNNRAAVAQISDSSLRIINLNDFTQATIIELSFQPSFIAQVGSGSFIVAGNSAVGSAAIELNSEELIEQNEWTFNGTMVDMCTTGDTLMVLWPSSVSLMHLPSMEVLSEFEHSAQTPYSIATNRGDVFVTDAADFISNGSVTQFSSHGMQLLHIEAGIIPQAMLFY